MEYECNINGCEVTLAPPAVDCGIRLCKACMNQQIAIAFANPILAGVDE